LQPTLKHLVELVDFDLYKEEDDDLYNSLHKMASELTEDILDFCRDKASDLYRTLENEYDYLTSDESIKETCEANEYLFTASGQLIY
jgi:hypothetical protein